MLIKIINPNTTVTMTEAMAECARRVAAANTRILAASPESGPVSIESHYDEMLSTPGLLDEIRLGEEDGCDGYVVACFGDPGLQAARELARGPVIGIAEAAMHAASMLGTGFSVVTTLARTRGMAWHLAERYGMRRFCRNVRAVEIPVLALEEERSKVFDAILGECAKALAEDDADVLVLGCAGMAGLAHDIGEALGVPVIDGVTVAVKLVEALVSNGLRTSKRGEYAQPLPKRYSGMLASYGAAESSDPA
ncbi:aspartate/glutamate racemase family protein [Paraburkholderia susongensis]|uniref:Hydantoin racemase n=1 Tax=Paraburkholderia susongensis TaxID=1515439 RepID=A0A1X7LVZ2_9BURK|nr:aspartate/glutamate racemase family protein [Paraburkholderia susongensis]SMG58076.1 allantoin racemase [Paraburkholderia susongensis]